jgi:hypothetical protein
VKKGNTEKFEGAAAGASPMVANGFIGYHKAMVLTAKPLSAFGAVDSMDPVYNMGSEENTRNDQCAKNYVTHI